MDAAAHARMAAYAAMVYNANRPPGYPAIAVIPDHAAGLAEEINSVVSGTQVHSGVCSHFVVRQQIIRHCKRLEAGGL